jgi:hypothetical protein
MGIEKAPNRSIKNLKRGDLALFHHQKPSKFYNILFQFLSTYPIAKQTNLVKILVIEIYLNF